MSDEPTNVGAYDATKCPHVRGQCILVSDGPPPDPFYYPSFACRTCGTAFGVCNDSGERALYPGDWNSSKWPWEEK